MLIVCPSCASSYVLDDARIGPAGRRVRCASCRETFFAAPPDEDAGALPPLSEQDGPEPAEAVAFAESEPADANSLWNTADGETGADDDSPDSTRERDPRTDAAAFEDALEAQWRDDEQDRAHGHVAEHWPDKQAEPRDLETEAKAATPAADPAGKGGRAEKKPKAAAKARIRVQPAAALLVLGFLPALAGLLLGRAQIVRLLPETAVIYAAIGMPVNLRGFTFENVRSELVREGEARLLVVEGEIANINGVSLAVPAVAIGVMGEGAVPLYRWTADPEQSTLAPGGRTRFKARLVSPPQDGRQVLVRFAQAGDVVPAAARTGGGDTRSSAADPGGKQ